MLIIPNARNTLYLYIAVIPAMVSTILHKEENKL